jgi:hypothetical protein
MWRDWLSSRSDDEEPESVEARQLRLRRWRRWALIGGSLMAIFSVGGVIAYRYGTRWLEERNRARIHGYLEQQDYRRVQLALEQAVQVSPHSVAARRALAEFYDAAGSPMAVARWREVVALAPNDDEPRLKLASVALRFEGGPAARVALEGVSPAGRASLDYHRVAAGVALVENNAVELQQQLEAMVKFEPQNLRTKLSLANLRVHSRDPAVVAGARDEIEQIARGEELRIHATLVLLSLVPRQEDDKAALRALAQRILPKGSLKPGTSELFALVEHMKGEPNPAAADAASLANWMISRGLAREALLWLSQQAAAVQKSKPVLMARADAAAQLHDWRQLRQLIGEGAWGRVMGDAVELAFAAHLQRERAGLANARETFSDAIEAASPSLPTLKILDRLCALWGWPEESERVLTRITRDFPRDQAAWVALLARAQASEKSARYWDVARRQALALPDDASAQSVRTYAAVITGQDDADANRAAHAALRRDDARGEELAAGVLLQWREKSPAEALAALSARQIETLRRTDKGAVVYAAALTASGRDARALVAQVAAGPLLPEERALLSRAAPPPGK